MEKSPTQIAVAVVLGALAIGGTPSCAKVLGLDQFTEGSQTTSGAGGQGGGGGGQGGGCVTAACMGPACDNMARDGSETDVDCGGAKCSKCDDGLHCSVALDCKSAVCGADKTCTAPTCSDKVLNQDESDIDCGGACAKCPSGSKCGSGPDCLSGVCTDGSCQASCSDTIKNGTETDIDCGGTACPRCKVDQSCLTSSDCASGAGCDDSTKKCVSGACSDGVKSAGETDIDCGGATCAGCAVGQSCGTTSDCLPGNGCDFTQHQCTGTLCTDNISNGGETGVDCGGNTSCPRCKVNETCATTSDCVPGDGCDMTSHQCTTTLCTDGIKNGGETGIDCGGATTCLRCKVGQSCVSNGDCLPGNGCNVKSLKCDADLCTDGILEVPETDTDCGSTCATKCPVTKKCAVTKDCVVTAFCSGLVCKRRVPGDFDGDGKADIAATGPTSWSTTPIALSKGDGTFTVSAKSSTLNTSYGVAGVQVLTGDFNGDGLTDLVGTAGPAWVTLPMGLSKGDGTFTVLNFASDFNMFTSQSGARALAGDFNADGWTDLIATGAASLTTLPIALSKGDGSFQTVNLTDPTGAAMFAGFAAQSGAKFVTGDFNGDGKADILATGVAAWTGLPIAFSKGDGSFTFSNKVSATNFNAYTKVAGAVVLSGDFNGDGLTDLLVTGVASWTDVPMAFSNGDGTFNFVDILANPSNQFWAAIASQNCKIIVGDIDGDGKDDIAATGGSSNGTQWGTLPVAISNGDGTFKTSNAPQVTFQSYSGVAGSHVFSNWN